MTEQEINAKKYKVCCPMCDNPKCVKGTAQCEAEIWAERKRMEQIREVIEILDSPEEDDVEDVSVDEGDN
jgi:hypothetical protein